MSNRIREMDDIGSEVEDDGDVDFNPFLREEEEEEEEEEEASSEASSSLSSENEGPADNASSWPLACDQDASNKREEEIGALSGDLGPTQPTSSSVQMERANDGFLGHTDNALDPTQPQNPSVGADEDDAICRRTRARHSLASYTLDELETFLQESDDDNLLRNTDDEREYRKFLAAVLQDITDVEQAGREDTSLDEDEENDADFVIELEEALESDADEYSKSNEGNQMGGARRPQTRQKKRTKESTKNKNYLLGQAKVPLRPILPNVPILETAPAGTLARQFSSPKMLSQCPPPQSGVQPIYGFTAHQIGQLHCLIHEHVQLLVQVFSVSAADPSRHQVATKAQKMITEMIDRRGDALARRKVPYPRSCFNPQNLHMSLHLDSHQTAKPSFWEDLMKDPVVSVLDVHSLALAKSYMTDVSSTVLEHKRRYLESCGDKNPIERKPLFPLYMPDSPSAESDGNLGGSTTKSFNKARPLPPVEGHTRKSLASTIVESTLKQSVALVPTDIADLAQRFCPLFNSALFPHSPPLPSVANRVLFTDAEDGLLAMGLMEYNHDWMAIQQRFLPCKSQHQIFVRQKNRSSSKAPENSIKAVRRMKSSPLTSYELARIDEGLKLFKHDWVRIWQFCVPHRDPSLLQRLWRTATGTQKSYSKGEESREKRRVYAAKKRQSNALVKSCQTPSTKEVSSRENMDGDMDDGSEAYVHEAFLADAEPSVPRSYDMSKLQSTYMMQYSGNQISEKCATVTADCGGSQQQNDAACKVVTSSKCLGDVHHSPHINVRHSAFSEHPSPNSISSPSTSQLGPWPCHMRRRKATQVVKLAPGLPPVNLPRSVRVISKSAFKSYNNGPSYSNSGGNEMKTHLHGFPQILKEGTSTTKHGKQVNMLSETNPKINYREEESIPADQCEADENMSESDIHMHPLLFQASEDQLSSYYSKKITATGTYNFFPENPVQVEANFRRPQSSVGTCNTHVQSSPLTFHTIDFHPLLQKADDLTGQSVMTSSVDQPSCDLEAQQGNCSHFPNKSILREPFVVDKHLEAQIGYHQTKEKLDLDIHLYSARNKERATQSLDMSEHRNIEENIPRSEHMVLENFLGANLVNNNNKSAEFSANEDLPIMSKKTMFPLEVIPSNAIALEGAEDSRGESLRDIVMEHEELSDSDEEIQHVEFECEEMDDSEGEGLGDEQSTESNTEEILTLASNQAEHQQINDLNQPNQASYAAQIPIGMDEAAAPLVSHESICTRLSHLKPKSECTRRDGRTSRSYSKNIRRSRPRQTSKTQSSEKNSLAVPRLSPTVAGEAERKGCGKRRKRCLSK